MISGFLQRAYSNIIFPLMLIVVNVNIPASISMIVMYVLSHLKY